MLLPLAAAAALKSPWLWAMLAPSILDRLPGLPESFLPAGQRGQLKLSRAQMKLQEKMFKAQQEGTRLTVKESRKRTDKMLAEAVSLRREERESAEVGQMMMMLMSSMNRGSQSIDTAINAMRQAGRPALPSTPSSFPPGLVGMLRR